MQRALIALIFILKIGQLCACTMEPNMWKRIDSVDFPGNPGIYALTEALYQIKEKFNKEMQACNLATGPLTFTGAWYGFPAKTVGSSNYSDLQNAINVVWKDAKLINLAEMVPEENDITIQNSVAAKLSSGYAITIKVTEAKSTAINLIDLNFHCYNLFRLVLRDELRLFVRITDRSGTAVFLDDITVSPTLIVDPLISPLGGFFIRVEKNTSRPLSLDFGPLSNGGDHVLRINDSFYQPSATPPLPEFMPKTSGLNQQ